MQQEDVKLKHHAVAFIMLGLTSCGKSDVPIVSPLKAGVEAEIFVTRRAASAQNSAQIILRDRRSEKSVNIFEGKGGANPKVVLLRDNQIVIQYCGATSINVKSYIYSIGEAYDLTNISVVVATSKITVQGMVFCGQRAT